MLHWSSDFVGIPHSELGRDRSGADCWGLLYIVFREHLNIEVPSYDEYSATDERFEIDQILRTATGSGICVPVLSGQEREFDVAVFRRGRLDSHVGVVVQPGLMLHMAEKQQSRIESYRHGYWKTRLTGIVRHVDLAK